MHTIWQQITLSTVPFQQWLNTSYLHQAVGALREWRQGSWLLRKWADWIGVGLVGFTLGLVPFANDLLVRILFAACAAYWLLLTISDGSVMGSSDGSHERVPTSNTLMTPIHLLVLLYWAIATVATAFSPVKLAAFTGWAKLTLYLIMFALMARVLRSPRARAWIIGVYLHAALVVSVYGIQQKIIGVKPLATWTDPDSLSADASRVYSYLENPNLLGGYLLPAIALSVVAVFAWQRWAPKLLALTMVGVNVACLYFTGSRGAWIGFAVLLFALLALLIYWWSVHLPEIWRILAIPIVLGGAATVLLIAVVVVEPLRDRVSSIFSGRNDSSNNFRINVWMSVIEMIKAHPILGIGPGNDAFNKMYPFYQRPRFSALSAYSIPLEIAVETGIIGLTCFAWLLLVTLKLGWSQLQQLRAIANRDGFWLMGAIAAMLGMLGHGLVDTVWYRPQISILWWLMVAIIAGYYSSQRSTPQSSAN